MRVQIQTREVLKPLFRRYCLGRYFRFSPLLGLLVILSTLHATPVFAEDAAAARGAYQECLSLQKSESYCKAARRCQAGVALYSKSPTLNALNTKAAEDCEENRPPRCPKGRFIGSKTDGQCCWPGQRWRDGACRGVPSRCPEFRVVNPARESCAVIPCEEGKILTGEVHCCWPGQRWGRRVRACLNPPRCPEGFTRKKNACKRDECAAGLQRDFDGEHCCPRGFRWSSGARVCEPPQCRDNESLIDGVCTPTPP